MVRIAILFLVLTAGLVGCGPMAKTTSVNGDLPPELLTGASKLIVTDQGERVYTPYTLSGNSLSFYALRTELKEQNTIVDKDFSLSIQNASIRRLSQNDKPAILDPKKIELTIEFEDKGQKKHKLKFKSDLTSSGSTKTSGEMLSKNENKKNNFKEGQTREEVWFSGIHTDVGGSEKESGLSDIALLWMMKNAEEKGLEISPAENINPNPLLKIHRSWVGFYWFTPWHMYGILVLGSLLTMQLVFAYLDLFYEITYRPFNLAMEFLCENWLATLAAVIGAIPFTRLSRKIPKDAKIHVSVKDKMQKTDYKPKNLSQAIEYGVIWVE